MEPICNDSNRMYIFCELNNTITQCWRAFSFCAVIAETHIESSRHLATVPLKRAWTSFNRHCMFSPCGSLFPLGPETRCIADRPIARLAVAIWGRRVVDFGPSTHAIYHPAEFRCLPDRRPLWAARNRKWNQ